MRSNDCGSQIDPVSVKPATRPPASVRKATISPLSPAKTSGARGRSRVSIHDRPCQLLAHNRLFVAAAIHEVESHAVVGQQQDDGVIAAVAGVKQGAVAIHVAFNEPVRHCRHARLRAPVACVHVGGDFGRKDPCRTERAVRQMRRNEAAHVGRRRDERRRGVRQKAKMCVAA